MTTETIRKKLLAGKSFFVETKNLQKKTLSVAAAMAIKIATRERIGATGWNVIFLKGNSVK